MSDSLDYYLAGVFDGEGSISAYLSKNGGWVLRCGVGMTELHVVSLFHERFGGGLCIRNQKLKSGLRMKDWYIGGGNAVDFLKWVSIFCKIKNRQSEVALPLAEQIAKYNKKGARKGKLPRSKIISDKDQKERRCIAVQLRSLNGARSRFKSDPIRDTTT